MGLVMIMLVQVKKKPLSHSHGQVEVPQITVLIAFFMPGALLTVVMRHNMAL